MGDRDHSFRLDRDGRSAVEYFSLLERSGPENLVFRAWFLVGVLFEISIVCLVFCVCGLFCLFLVCFGEFDPGSGRTLAACLTHASRTVKGPVFAGSG